MKFLHLSDLHLGRSISEIPLVEDQRFLLDQVLRIVDQRNIDAVVIAGDVYDKSIPSEAAVQLLDGFLKQLSKRNVSTIMISGNHDSDERLNFASSLLKDSGVYIAGKYNGNLECVTVNDEFGPVHFWLLPFVKAGRVRDYHPETDTSNYDAAIRSALSFAKPNTKERNVIVAHQFVTYSGKTPEGAGSESNRPEIVGTVEMVDANAFDDYDYVALGHIHKPQRIGRETCRYAGSPLKYSLAEVNGQKSIPLITMAEKGNTEIELIPVHPLHDMRMLKGSLEDMLNQKDDGDPMDYIYAIITDEQVTMDASRLLQNRYPNLLRMEYRNSVTEHDADYSALEEDIQSFDELIALFFERVIGRAPDEEDRKIIEQAAKESGVNDETD